MPDIPEFIDHLGEIRRLGWVPPSNDGLMMRGSTASVDVIPRSEWREVDFISPLGRRCINNQRSCGGCTGWSAAQASMRARLIRGQEFLRLSGAAIYAQINGGRDAGSNIIDSLNAFEKNGTCLESEMDFPSIFAKSIPQGSLRFREDPAVRITTDTFDRCATILQKNGLPQFPLCATNRWTSNTGYDSDGVADLSSSRSSNHSVHGALLVQYKPSFWGIVVPNTWGLQWGPWVNQNPPWYAAFIARNNITPVDQFPLAGCVLIVPDHIDNCDQSNDGYAHMISLDPSQSSGVPAPSA